MHKTTFRVLLALAAAGGPVRAGAEIFRVGPSGQFATIQQALTQAAQTPATPSSTVSHDIRIQGGTYRENLRLPVPCCGGRSIRVSGGWNALFNLQGMNPAATVVDGRDRGRVFTAASFTSGSIMLDRLTLREGLLHTSGPHNFAEGAGLHALLGGTARLVLYQTHVRDNVIRGTGASNAEAQGAGASVVLNDSASLSVFGSRFQNNLTVQADTALAGYGGGLAVQARDHARVTVQRSEFVGNWAYGSRLSYGGGLFASADDGSGTTVVVEDSYFQGNVVSPIGLGSAIELRRYAGEAGAAARITRCRIVSNIGGSSQLSATATGGSRIDLSDSLVARGRGGVRALASDAVVNLTNLTVADNELRGIQGSVDGGRLAVVNTIAYGNATGDLSLAGTGVVASFNLVGIDPMFEPGSYELGGASPAADAGLNTPAAGLGVMDLARRDRIYNATVDIGAYEWFPF